MSVKYGDYVRTNAEYNIERRPVDGEIVDWKSCDGNDIAIIRVKEDEYRSVYKIWLSPGSHSGRANTLDELKELDELEQRITDEYKKQLSFVEKRRALIKEQNSSAWEKTVGYVTSVRVFRERGD
jgi:hypothetical protein